MKNVNTLPKVSCLSIVDEKITWFDEKVEHT